MKLLSPSSSLSLSLLLSLSLSFNNCRVKLSGDLLKFIKKKNKRGREKKKIKKIEN
jgi:hypothetical protein